MAVFNGSEGSYITQALAKSLGTNYVNSDRYAEAAYVKAHFVGKDKLDALLNQDGCMGLRIYYGTQTPTSGPGTPDLVIVGTDEDGNDMLEEDLILDASIPCPPTCPPSGKGVMD
jgi:hypothetical protein